MRSQYDEEARVWNVLLCVDEAANSKQGCMMGKTTGITTMTLVWGSGLMNKQGRILSLHEVDVLIIQCDLHNAIDWRSEG